MKTQPRFTAVVVGTTSMIALQVLGVPSPLLANAHNSAHVTPIANNVLLSQATASRIRFVPPVDKNARRSQGSGSRGCRNQSVREKVVTLLIPSKDYVGQTVSGHPTFFLYLSQPVSVPMQFSVVEDKSGGKTVFKQPINAVQPGIIQIEMPKDQPELVSGRIYRWNVTLLCNPNRPSENVFLQSWIERVPMTQVLEQQLAVTPSHEKLSPEEFRDSPAETLRDRASIYAGSGLWYDAVATLSDALNAHPKDILVQQDFFSLLDQVGLSEVAKQERQRLTQK